MNLCLQFINDQSFSALREIDCARAPARGQNVLSADQFCAHFQIVSRHKDNDFSPANRLFDAKFISFQN